MRKKRILIPKMRKPSDWKLSSLVLALTLSGAFQFSFTATAAKTAIVSSSAAIFPQSVVVLDRPNTVILQIFGVVLFSVFSVVNGFTEFKKTPKREKYIE